MPLTSTLMGRGADLARPVLDLLTAYAGYVASHKRRSFNVAAALTALTVVGTAVRLYRRVCRPPPQLRHLPQCNWFDTLMSLFRDDLAYDFSRKVIRPAMSHGGVYTRFAAEGWVVDLAEPLAVKTMLFKTDNFPKSETTMGLEGTLIHRFVGGPNIVFLSGHDWKRHRKIANPAFHRAFPVKMFASQTHEMFVAMEGQDTFDVVDLFSRLTLDAIGRAGFGFNFNALRDKDNKWVTGYNSIKDGMIKPLFIMFPIFDTKLLWMFPERRKAHANLTEFLAMLDQIIENKRNVIAEKKLASVEDNENDLLSLMIESGLEEGDAASLSNEELKSNLCIFFLAGHDTTAYALSYIIYEMARHPDVQEKARQEAISILGDGSDDMTPSYDQTKQMTYLNAVIKETLRLYNPLYGTTTRVANEDCDLNGHFIPKGTMVNINIFDLHRNPDVWESPDAFKPERFLPGGEAERQPGSGLAWVPFSNGGRQCVGMQFSLVEQRVVLSLLLRKFTFHLPENSIHKEKLQLRGIVFGITSISDLTVTFKKRH